MPTLIRLYTDMPLCAGVTVLLDPGHGHYLRQVMRRGEGDEIELFNGRDGAFSAKISVLTKKLAQAEVGKQLRPPDTGCEIVLFCAPIKRSPLEFMAQKATELGVGSIVPVRTERTVVKGINRDRLMAIMIEASEQCERVSIPTLSEEVTLTQMLASLDFPVLFADEAGNDPEKRWGGPDGRAMPLLGALEGANLGAQGKGAHVKIGILVGPEGGFKNEERETLRNHPLATPVSLGQRILRAETAAIVALSVLAAKLDLAQ